MAPDQQCSQMFFCTYQKCLLLISGSLLKTVHNITSCWPCQCYFWLYIFSLFPASPLSGTSPFPAAVCIHGFDFFRRVGSAGFKTAGGGLDEHIVSPKMRLLLRLSVGLGLASQSAGPVLASLRNGDPSPKTLQNHFIPGVLEVSFHLWLNIEYSCIRGNCWNVFILDHLNTWRMWNQGYSTIAVLSSLNCVLSYIYLGDFCVLQPFLVHYICNLDRDPLSIDTCYYLYLA